MSLCAVCEGLDGDTAVGTACKSWPGATKDGDAPSKMELDVSTMEVVASDILVKGIAGPWTFRLVRD